jgi:hypothetical protein
MTTPTKPLSSKSNKSALYLAVLAGLTVTAPVFAADATATNDSGHEQQMNHEHNAPAKLVQIVREATRQFIDVNATASAEYFPAFGCVSGPDHGAMGIHYVNMGLVGDGEIDANHPEALIYEPSGDRFRLVGVEYIVDAVTWLKHHKEPPMLEGQAFQLVSSPNRFNLPTFFELHVWAWRDNPNGAFVDWNNNVSCEH